MVEADLHLHTTFSDGRLTPAELVRLCARRGLKVIAITDHDSTEGLPEALDAARSFPGFTVIPGIELGADVPEAEIHVLGYYVDYEDGEFRRTMTQFRDGRRDRARRMVEKLAGLGIDIEWERVEELSGGGAVGRPHIAQAMVEAGYVRYPKEAFDKYIHRGGPAYVERRKLSPEEAIALLADNGALPVMAHPTYAAPEDAAGAARLRKTLKDLKAAGLVGMEVFYKDYTPEQVERLSALAGDLGLIPLGGSDYHASGNPGEPEPGSVGPPLSAVEALAASRRRVGGRLS